MKRLIILSTILISSLAVFSQENLAQTAENFYAERDYENAAATYEKLLAEGESALVCFGEDWNNRGFACK